MLRITFFTLLISSTIYSPAVAEKDSKIESILAEIGETTVHQKFDGPLDKTAIPVKGEWKVIDGVLLGKELASDKHAGGLKYQKQNHNSVVRFSFKLDGNTTGFNLSLNHAKGHLFRVVVTPTAMSINLDKDKKDPESKAQVLGRTAGKFKQEQWYTMQVEMLGDRVVAQTDNGVKIEASHPTLDASKPNYRFVMKGESLSIDDLQIWELK